MSIFDKIGESQRPKVTLKTKKELVVLLDEIEELIGDTDYEVQNELLREIFDNVIYK